MPFHIVGGHVTTNLNQDLKLLAVSLDGKQQSVPIIIDFQESTTSGTPT
jgi:hypothetical protein